MCTALSLGLILLLSQQRMQSKSWFHMADEFENTKSDLPIQLTKSISTWSITIYLTLNHKKVLPNVTKTILVNLNGCGYTFLHWGYILFNPSLVTNPVRLSSKHLHQGKLTYDEYVQVAEFHYNIQELVVNHNY